MDTGFIFQPGVGSLAVHNKVRFLDAAQLGLVIVEQLDAPAPGSGVHGIHPKQAVGKQGAFLAADASPDLHDDALFVIGVLGQKQNL